MEIRVLLFAQARHAAGGASTLRLTLGSATVGDAEDTLVGLFGPAMAEVLERCRFWVNGEPAERERKLMPGDELAVLPPVSGGQELASRQGWDLR